MHAEDLRRYLADATGRAIRLRVNANAHSMISAGRDGMGPGIRVSLHRIFLEADSELLAHLAAFVVRPTPASREAIRAFINRQSGAIAAHRPLRPRRIRGTHRGKVYELGPRADAINARYFGGRLEFQIIWGKPVRAGRRQAHVTLGTWNDRQRLIRIHPMLDNPNVPEWFLDFIIYHEMIHIEIPMRAAESGRAVIHPPEFRAMEARFPHYRMACAWEKRWLPALLREWNGGPPLPAAANDLDLFAGMQDSGSCRIEG